MMGLVTVLPASVSRCPRGRRLFALAGLIVSVVGLGGCGGGAGKSPSASRTTTLPAQAPVTIVPFRPQPPLRDSSAVVVRSEQLLILDALWNMVTIHADGRGQVAQWIGETSPIRYFHFRLTAAQLARVRRWLGQAVRLRRIPQPTHVDPGTYIYLIRSREFTGRLVEVDLPRPLRQLTEMFDRLIGQYS